MWRKRSHSRCSAGDPWVPVARNSLAHDDAQDAIAVALPLYGMVSARETARGDIPSRPAWRRLQCCAMHMAVE